MTDLITTQTPEGIVVREQQPWGERTWRRGRTGTLSVWNGNTWVIATAQSIPQRVLDAFVKAGA